MNLLDKSAIVTGASRGIGRAITEALLNEGVTVSGWSRTQPEELTHKNFRFVEADLTQQKSVDQAFNRTVELLGSDIDILINNAGAGHKGLIEEMPVEKWHELFDLNVHGIFYLSRRIIPGMKEREKGHIINISSGAGTNGIAGMSCYAATKHAVVGMTRSMHKELRNYGVKASILSPGSVDTGFSDSDKNKLKPEDMARAVVHMLQCPQNFHYTDVQVRPLQP
jgi:short-subunit dehydrogenase